MDSAGGSTVLKSPGFVSVRHAARAVCACWCTSLLLPHVIYICIYICVYIIYSHIYVYVTAAATRAADLVFPACSDQVVQRVQVHTDRHRL